MKTGVVKEGLADMTPEWPGSQQASKQYILLMDDLSWY